MEIMSRWHWILRKISRELWLTTVVYSLVALLSVLLAPNLQSYVPDSMGQIVSPESVKQLLNILASTMLAVTTFSLTTMVSANNAVRNNTSPRASSLILDDGITRNALGAFIGSFLFSLIGIISFNVHLYGPKGHIILFFCTLFVVTMVVAVLLRWINYLIGLGKMSKVFEKVENEARKALEQYVSNTSLGCRPLSHDDKVSIPASARSIFTQEMGYIQHIDLKALEECSKAFDGHIYIVAVPGDFVDASQAIAKYTGLPDEETLNSMSQSFTIGNERSFDYDPRFGLTVLSEIASRALSSGINDSGTAIDILTRLNRVLYDYFLKIRETSEKENQASSQLWMRPLDAVQMLELCFLPIARDGCHQSEVHCKLQGCFASLLYVAPELKAALSDISEQSFAYVESGEMIKKEIAKIRAMALHFK